MQLTPFLEQRSPWLCLRSLRALLAALGPAAPAHSILVFTRGDELEADDTPLYEFLRDSPPYLKARAVNQHRELHTLFPFHALCMPGIARSQPHLHLRRGSMPATCVAGWYLSGSSEAMTVLVSTAQTRLTLFVVCDMPFL